MIINSTLFWNLLNIQQQNEILKLLWKILIIFIWITYR